MTFLLKFLDPAAHGAASVQNDFHKAGNAGRLSGMHSHEPAHRLEAGQPGFKVLGVGNDLVLTRASRPAAVTLVPAAEVPPRGQVFGSAAAQDCTGETKSKEKAIGEF